MKYELYEYQIMLFELMNALAMFQRLINYVLYDHLNEFVIVYLNDILIFSENEKKHEIGIDRISMVCISSVHILFRRDRGRDGDPGTGVRCLRAGDNVSP